MPFIAAKSVMFVRNTPARTTSSKLLLAAFRTADRFWKTRSVSGTMPPSTTLPVAGSWATWPLKKRKPSILTAWENGPTGGESSGEVIAVLLIAAPVVKGTFVVAMSRPLPFHEDNLTGHFSAKNCPDADCRGVPIVPQVQYLHDDVASGARCCYWLGAGFRRYWSVGRRLYEF